MLTCQNCYSCQKGVSAAGSTPNQIGPDVSKCRVCYSCQKGVSPSVTAGMKGSTSPVPEGIKKGSMGGGHIFYVHFTPTCNLACDYCYTGNDYENNYFMEDDVEDATLKYLFKTQPHEMFTVHFFGGEPTVRWEQLVNFVSIGNGLASGYNKKVSWGMTTNGILLNDEKLDWIEKNFKKDNPFLLSIDGRPSTHNKHRIKLGGKGSYDDIPVKEILRRFPNIEIRPTILPDTAGDWFADYCYLRDLGFKHIAIEASFESSWTEDQFKDYAKLLEQLGDYYVFAKKSDKPIKMQWIDTVAAYFNNNRQKPSGKVCGVGFNCEAIDFRGLIYPCQRYASYNDISYAIGDVFNGVSEFRRLQTNYLTREQVLGDARLGFNCETCLARCFCYKGCNAANNKIMGSRDVVVPNFCRMTIMQVKEALLVLAKLGEFGTMKREDCSRC